jgi:hypothetical protein
VTTSCSWEKFKAWGDLLATLGLVVSFLSHFKLCNSFLFSFAFLLLMLFLKKSKKKLVVELAAWKDGR